jgi:hypothetical protein
LNVVAVELGERPLLFTKSRRFAPEGVKVLAELLGHMQFATDGIIFLDWSNQLDLQPDAAAIPVVVVRTTKWFPEWNQSLTVEVRLDVEDLFGNDNVTANALFDIVQSIESSFIETVERRRNT